VEILSLVNYATAQTLRADFAPQTRPGGDAMLKTPLCDVLGIDVPIILAPMGTCTSAEFAAVVSNEGGLGGIGPLFRSTAAVKRDIDMVKRLTSRPFAINHIPQALDAETFHYTLQAKPRVVSFALADPGDLVQQAHSASCLPRRAGLPARASLQFPQLNVVSSWPAPT
jgi:NAD(P)H-dependent flavin oxidoreductase YrpB (nitropropane dioxygenase family)